MKETVFKGVILLMLLIPTISSCRGKGKRVAEKVYKEYKAASKSDAVQYLKRKNQYDQAKKIYDGIFNSPCNTCNGYGVVYLVDAYGYAITDYNGNYQFQLCPHCGGTGED